MKLNKVVATSLLALTFATLSGSNAMASAVLSNGNTSQSYTVYSGCLKLDDSFSLSWSTLSNNGSISQYTYSMSGVQYTYDTCNGNALVNTLTWTDWNHQVKKGDELKVSTVKSTSTNNGSTLKYLTNIVGGEVKMTNIWVDGVKVN